MADTTPIPIADLPTVTPGNYDYVVVAQNGNARKALAPEVTAAAAALTEALDEVVSNASTAAAAELAALGYRPPVAYAASINLTSPNQTVDYGGNIYAPIASELPFTTSGTFEDAKFRLIVPGMFIQSGTGAVARTMQDKARDIVSSSDFSATADFNSAKSGKVSIDSSARLRAPAMISGDEELTGAAVRDAFVVGRTVNGLTNCHGFADRTIISGNSDGGFYGVFDATSKYTGTQNGNHIHSFQDRIEWGSSGTLSIHDGLYSMPVFSAGTVSQRNGVTVYDYSGAGTATINTAIRIKSLTKGVNNYAIVSEGNTPSYHIGTFTVGGVPDTNSGISNKVNTLSGTTQIGIKSGGAGNSAATTEYSAFSGAAFLLAGSYTTSNAYGYKATAAGKGAGVSLTNNFGFYCENQTAGTNNWAFYAAGTTKSYFGGSVGIGPSVASPSARLHIGAGSATAGTAPIKLSAGTLLSSAENGAFEYDGTNLYFTVGGVRKIVNLT